MYNCQTSLNRPLTHETSLVHSFVLYTYFLSLSRNSSSCKPAQNGFIFCQGVNETFRQFVVGQAACEVVQTQRAAAAATTEATEVQSSKFANFNEVATTTTTTERGKL